MKKLILLVVTLAAILPFSNISLSQELDSLILSTSNINQGDTAIVTLSLVNSTFPVGGFTALIVLPDSIKARFIYVEPGASVIDFNVFSTPFTDGSLRIVSFANTVPNTDNIPPLPLGYHELAVIKIALDDTIAEGSHLDIVFYQSGEYINAITDSTGYLTIIPEIVDGEIIIYETAEVYDNDQIPSDFSLSNNYPNPFNAGTNFEFAISEPGYVSFEIYDVLGKKVTCLFDSYAIEGNYTLRWNGFSDSGESVASGIYFYRLLLDGQSITKKMNLLK